MDKDGNPLFQYGMDKGKPIDKPTAYGSAIGYFIDNNNGKIITVIGCGGNRDKGKRPQMANIAYKASSQLILTSDNPRYENPSDIINDMLNGLTSEQQDNVLCIENREQAIKTACKMAKSGDIVFVAGKGHENYQEIEGVKHPFNDKAMLENLLK